MIRTVLMACCLLAFMSAAANAVSNIVSIPQAVAAGGDNVSSIVQVGSNNFAVTDQTGWRNTAAIVQFGYGNYSKVNQTGMGGIVVDTQIGYGNQFTVTQTGSNPPPIIITQHR